MSGEMAVSLALKFADQGSTQATQALQKITRAIKETGDVAKSASATAMSAFQKLANARETLGIRSEKAIQNEIRQTEAAYERLATSGQSSARELGRAQDAMRQKVAELRREMDGARNSAAGMPSALRGALGVMGAYQAGKMIVGQPVKQTMAYDRALAHLSNTAYAGQSLDARQSGMRTLDAAIVSAVRAGGGTREGALGTLDKLVASGAFPDMSEATRLLPVLTRSGTASNSDPSHLADIAIRAKQTFGLPDTGLALDQAIKAGQLGGFELKDMAKWLPQQMAMARQSGLRGDQGFRTLLAANQAAAITAGSKDEAGNNLVNLLAKINSQDTANDAKKLGINLSGALSAARGKGVNSLDAFVNLTEQIVAKDKNYLALREKSRTATGDEQRATFGAMGDILQGSAIGKIVQDRQALMALVGITNNRGYMNDIRNQLDNARGTTDQAFGLISETPSYKAELLAAEKATAMQLAMDKVNPLLGSMAETLTKLMTDFPVFTAGLVAATTALAALAAAAGGAALPGILTGAGAGAGAGAVATRIGAGLSGAAVTAAGYAGPAALVAGAGAAGYGAGTLLNKGINGAVSWATGRDETLGGMIYDWTHRTPQNGQVLPSQSASQTVRNEIKLVVDGRQIAEAINEYNSRSAARN